MGWVEQFVNSINDVLWGPPLLFLIVGTGIYLTFRVLFIQVRLLPYSLKLAFSKQDHTSEGDISHFQALMTALAATVGPGNIVGVASGIIAGGPGAMFWMWFAAFFVMYYRSVFVIAVFFGAVFKNHLVWGVADMLNGLMAIPNLIGLICLSGVVVFESKRIIDKLKQEKKKKNISVSS